MTETRTEVESDVGVFDSAPVRAPITVPRPASTARTVSRVVIAGLFAYCGFNAALEGWSEARDIVTHAPEPLPGILLFQILVFITSLLSAVGTWRRSAWASRAVIAWGVVGAIFVALLQPMLDLPRQALPQLLAGSALLLAIAAGVVVFLRREPRLTSASAAPVHDRQKGM